MGRWVLALWLVVAGGLVSGPAVAQAQPQTRVELMFCSQPGGTLFDSRVPISLSEARPYSTIHQARCRGTNATLHVAGPITPALAAFVDRFVSDMASSVAVQRALTNVQSPLNVSLDSDGGDVDAAIQIGRVIRRIDARTSLYFGATCRSACVLILAAGVERRISPENTEVAIHRPYFIRMRPGRTTAEVAADIRTLDQTVSSYLDEMGMPRSLFEAMRVVSPNSSRVLSRPELEGYGLIGSDPVFDERKTAQEAAVYGLESAAYRRLLSRADAACGTYEAGGNVERRTVCRSAILYGISEAEYERRKAVNDRCYDRFQNSRGLVTLPEADYQEVLACYRRAMFPQGSR